MLERVTRRWSPWWTVIAAAVPVVLTLWSHTPPGGYFTTSVVALLCWVAVGSVWLFTGVAAVVVLPPPRPRHLARLWPYLLVPALMVTTEVVVDTGVVPRAAFAAHRSALEALVAEVGAAPDRSVRDRRVGLFTVSWANVDGSTGCTVLKVADAGFLDATGYAHCPDRAPVDVVAGGEGYTFEPIDGPWYGFTARW
ncbi:hypothetical protein AB0K14_33925 [Actinosynnema sp. NPDC050801]|uniref:hypothetical protein n=1 Tax=unclassified Actinosynnema TaxID=2637065 RepID=UPI0033D52143